VKRITNIELIEQLEEILRKADAKSLLTEFLEEVQPFDLAEVLTQFAEEDELVILSALELSLAAEVLEHLEFLDEYRLLHHMDQVTAQAILDQMSSDAVADLIGSVHPRQAANLFQLIPSEYVTTIRSLMSYDENSAGGRMSVDFISARQYMTVEQVLAHIRKVGREADTVSYIYVVDAHGRLTGVVSLRELIMSRPEERVSEVMSNTMISVPATMDQEEVASIVSKYDLVAVPVVNADNRLMGIITVDNIIDVLQEEASEDVYRMGATSMPESLIDRTFLQSVWSLAKPRIPWLVGLLFLEIGSGAIVDFFSGIVKPEHMIFLAAFSVVMAGESGNAATQSLAIVVRGLATGEIKTKDMTRVVWREAMVGVLVGLMAGATLFLTILLWKHNLTYALIAGLALAGNLLVAKILGGLFPVIIQRIGIDPAVASGPLITTLTDNSSMLLYYGTAAIILRFVV
jgi:magnesium transporter